MKPIICLFVLLSLFSCTQKSNEGNAKVIKGAQATEVTNFMNAELAPINTEFNGSSNYQLTEDELDLLLEKGAITSEQHQSFLKLI